MNDEKKLFSEIKSLVVDWYEENQTYFKKHAVETEVLRDEKDGFVVSFETDKAMAELVVEQASFTPYRFVSFEIATIEDDKANISYSWYDSYETSNSKIKRMLKKGTNCLIRIK